MRTGPLKKGFNLRPWSIPNNDTSPFAEEESLAVTIIQINDADWEKGGSPVKSYASPFSPWVVTTLKHVDLQEKQGQLKEKVVETVAQRFTEYLKKKPLKRTENSDQDAGRTREKP